ncbi:hypothetical protein [Alkalibaculum sporogenes]|uniref:hypothetical protein n=1 Tax=Alkalibaculum sporogenes TaxID=2655001 RepID=UPI0031B5CEAE
MSCYAESIYKYEFGQIKLLAYKAECLQQTITLSVHSQIRWVETKELLDFDLAPADIPIAEKLFKAYRGNV